MTKRGAFRKQRVTYAKANPAFASARYVDLPQAQTMPRNYRAYAQQAYACDPTIFKVINYITQNGAAIPPKLYTDATMETELEKHPLLDLLNRPNPEQSAVAFRQAVLGYFLISGNSYQYGIRAGKAGPFQELWTLEPDKTQPVVARFRGVEAFRYKELPQDIPPDQVGWLKSWNPVDPVFGLSRMEVAAILVDQQTAARKWNLALMQNSGKMSGAWSTDAILGKDERDRLEQRVNQKTAGPANAGKMAVLDGGLKFVQNSVTPSELDWLKSQQYNAVQIANIYDIAPQLIGDTSASTYNNMDAAKVASYTEGIFPVLDLLYSLWNSWLLPLYPDLGKAYLYYDKTSIEVIAKVIQDQKNAEADRAIKAWNAGSITLNQSLTLQGLEDIGPDGDVYKFGAVLVPKDKLSDYAAQSLEAPAAPPMPQAEPLNGGAVAPSGNAPGTPPEGQQPPLSPKQGDSSSGTDKKPTAPPKKARKAASDATTLYNIWHCAPGCCDFCAENDGACVQDGDSFPNGCMSPEDCHNHCKCTMDQIELPDNTGIDPTSDDDINFDWLIARYGVAFFASNHDKEQAQQQAQDDDEGDDDEYAPEYAPPEPVKPTPHKKPKSRRAYRALMRSLHE